MTTSIRHCLGRNCGQPTVADEFLAYVYDGTLEGLLSAVFYAYEYREYPVDVAKESCFQARIGQRVRVIQTDVSRAQRVRDGLIRVCGWRVYSAVRAVSLSDEPDAGFATLRFIKYAMERGKRVLQDLVHPDVERFDSIRRFVGGEQHQMLQFIRFRKVEGGVYVAQCSPKASVVPLIMGRLAERFNDQPFLVHDRVHEIAGVYDGRSWWLTQTKLLQIPPDTLDEKTMARAWKVFYDTISVEARYNPELRRSNMPVRFWQDLTELKEDVETIRGYGSGQGVSDPGDGGNAALAPGVMQGLLGGIQG